MKKRVYFKSEKDAQAACRSLRNAGISKTHLEYRFAPDTLDFVARENPAGLYFGSGTVYVPEIGFVSGRAIQNEPLGTAGYASFLNFSGKHKGVTMNIEYTPKTEGIAAKHNGRFLSY